MVLNAIHRGKEVVEVGGRAIDILDEDDDTGRGGNGLTGMGGRGGDGFDS